MPEHGSKLYIAVEDSAASTLRNISPYANNVAYPRQNDIHDTTTFGVGGAAGAHTFITGLTNGTMTITGLYDTTATVGSATVLESLLGITIGTTVAYEYGPLGNASGKPKYSGECVLTNFDHSAPVADLVTFTATLQLSGAQTKGTFSA